MFTIESIDIIDWGIFGFPNLKASATITIAGKLRVSGIYISQSAPGKPVEVSIPSEPHHECPVELEFIDDDLKLEVESAIIREYEKLLGVFDLPTKALLRSVPGKLYRESDRQSHRGDIAMTAEDPEEPTVEARIKNESQEWEDLMCSGEEGSDLNLQLAVDEDTARGAAEHAYAEYWRERMLEAAANPAEAAYAEYLKLLRGEAADE